MAKQKTEMPADVAPRRATFGILAVVCGLIGYVLAPAVFAAVIAFGNDPQSPYSEAISVGLVGSWISSLSFAFMAIGFGLVSLLVMKETNRVPSLIGIVIAAAYIMAGLCALMGFAWFIGSGLYVP